MSSIAGRIAPPRQAAYAATKWAIEAFTEALAIELGGFGIDVGLVEPGPVSSDSLDNMPAYSLPDDPYAALFAQGGVPREVMISPEQVAATLAELVEQPTVPLRVPGGRAAERFLAARNAAPYDQPLVPA